MIYSNGWIVYNGLIDINKWILMVWIDFHEWIDSNEWILIGWIDYNE